MFDTKICKESKLFNRLKGPNIGFVKANCYGIVCVYKFNIS